MKSKVTVGDVMRTWYAVARMRDAKGDRVGAERARRNARAYRARPRVVQNHDRD